MTPTNSLIEDFNAIQTIDELNEKAPKLHYYFLTVSGLLSRFKYLDVNTTGLAKKNRPNQQKKYLYDKNNKHEIQALFHRQQHRAVQEILIGPTLICHISQEKVENRYNKLLSQVPQCNISELPPFLWQSPSVEEKSNEQIIRSFTPEEVKRKLLMKIRNPLANSRTVGLDKIRYIDLIESDRDCLILTSFFNACLRVQAVPDIWKKVYSVLIKNSAESDDDDIKNWRIVTMFNSIPKLFQSLIAARLIVWAQINHRLSPTQKGLLSYNAACESSFILQECHRYAKKNNHDLAVAWLDFSSASESIPQEAVLQTLIRHSVPVSMRNIIKDSLCNVETKIRLMLSDDGYTNPIKILKGLPQGSPLNPILMDLVLEPVLRTLAAEHNNVFQIFNQKINHFVIPNELVLIADSTTKLQGLLKLVENTAKTTGLQFKIDNCITYHYDSTENKIKDSSLLFFGQTLKTLSEDKVIDYFQVRQGLSIGQDGIPTIQEMLESVYSVSDSKLTIFQKSVAIQNYVIPRAESCLRGLQDFNKEFLTDMDTMLKDKFKSWLAVPEAEGSEAVVFHCVGFNKKKNKSSYLPLLDLFYIMKIVHAYKMLTCDDQIVKKIALDSLTAEVLELAQKEPKSPMPLEEVIKYLSGGLHIKATENNTIWKMAREASLNLKIKINFVWKYDVDSKEIQLVLKKQKSKVISERNWLTDIASDLKEELIKYYINEVIKKHPDIKRHQSTSGTKLGLINFRSKYGSNKSVFLKPLIENAFNMRFGYPPIYNPQQLFMQGLIC